MLCKDCKNCVVKENVVRCSGGRWFDADGGERKIKYVSESNLYFGCKVRFGENNPMKILDCKNFENMEGE